jgi:hypothetical protein
MDEPWTDYPNLRENLAPQFAELSDEQIDALVEQVYGEGITAEDLEGFFDDLKNGLGNVGRAVGHFAQQAAPVLQKALPGVAQGAMAGSALGPWGMLAGAIAGGAGSALAQSRNPTLRGIGQGLGTATQLAGAIRGGAGVGGVAQAALGGLSQLAGGRGGAAGNIAQAALGQLAGGRGGAGGNIAQAALGGLSQLAAPGGKPQGASANALLGLLARPEVGQALMSAAMGALGRQQVQVGSSQVGVQSILNAIGSLAGRAAGEMVGTETEGIPEYFYGADGELAFDPSERHSRTDALLTYMVLTAPAWAAPRPPVVVVQPREPEYTKADADADEALWAEVYASEYEEDEAYA